MSEQREYTKQELWERMPIIRFENWGMYYVPESGTYEWMTEEERRAHG